ncbi:hypothetical protein M0Q50_06285 [bacterium]|jgi:hypothetical protein|nr:hypothetical protein [bacterium]
MNKIDRISRKNQTKIETNDMFENFIKNFLRINEDEYNFLLDSLTEDEKRIFVNPLTFQEKRNFIKIFKIKMSEYNNKKD